jgi:signal-transduction protein with cAMP-binding, CBS, and nucleotidyltransferase domain
MAPALFVQKILTSLNCSMFLTGSLVQERGKDIVNFNIFIKGSVEVFANEQVNGEATEFHVSNLSEGSWFGDYQILMATVSWYNVKAGFTKINRESRKYLNYIQVYQIEASRFKKVCKNFPEFSTFLIRRGYLRRAYWYHTL